MKYFYTLLAVLVVNSAVSQCTAPTAVTISIKGNERMVIVGGGSLFGATPSLPAYSIQDGNAAKSLLYALGSWIGGVDSDGQLRLAASTYEGFGGSDFFAGPLSEGTAETDNGQCLIYDAIWFFNRAQVERHHAYYECLADPNCEDFPLGYTTPESFYNYPAHGDISAGMPYYLFAFYDRDQDGNYNPDNGDCPGFSGLPGMDDCCKSLKGDVCAITIANDKGNVHSASGGEQIGVELQKMVYYFNSPALSNTALMRTNWINRGSQTLSDTYIAYFIDADLGAPFDDQYGADPDRDLFFFYNGDENDNEFGSGGDIPITGFKLLSGVPEDADEVDNDNDGVVDNERIGAVHSVAFDIPNQLPVTAVGHYNLMKGQYSNGQPFNEGGVPVDFHQVGYPTGSENYVPTDVRQIVSTGGFTLAPGQDFCTEGAYFFKTGTDDVLSAFDGFAEKADSIQMYFDDCFECVPPTVHIFSEAINGGYAFMNFSSADTYLWDFGDGETSTLKFPQHVFAESATFTVSLTVSNDCGTATGTYELDAVVGVSEDMEASVQVFPNPTSDQLNIRFESVNERRLTLLSSTGQTVFSHTVFADTEVVDVSSYAAGFYILTVDQKDGSTLSYQVMIQN